MKKFYIEPNAEMLVHSLTNDIMLNSDVDIDGSSLFVDESENEELLS